MASKWRFIYSTDLFHAERFAGLLRLETLLVLEENIFWDLAEDLLRKSAFGMKKRETCLALSVVLILFFSIGQYVIAVENIGIYFGVMHFKLILLVSWRYIFRWWGNELKFRYRKSLRISNWSVWFFGIWKWTESIWLW